MKLPPHVDRTPCLDDPYPYDVLVDITSGPEYAHALREAAAMCGRCPVLVQCHTINAAEPWVTPVSRILRGLHVNTKGYRGRKRPTE